MDKQAVLALYDREMRMEMQYPGMAREATPEIVRFIRPTPGRSFVLYSRLTEANADAVIAAQVAELRARQLYFDWKAFAHDTPADLYERLAAHGGVPEEADTLMVLDLAQSARLSAPPAGDVRRLSDPAQLRDVVQVMRAVWGGEFAWIHERMGGHMLIPDYLSVYVAYVADEPVATAWVYFYPQSQFVGLWGGSTIPAQRGRGLYTALLAVRVQEARARGYRYATVDAGQQSGPIVARHGFEALTTTVSFDWDRA